MPGTKSHSVLPHARPEHAKHRPKTKAAKHGKGQKAGQVNKKEIDADGLPIEVRKKTAQQKQYDVEHKVYEQRLRDYKQQNPEFKDQMDKVVTLFLTPTPALVIRGQITVFSAW